ncbi:hypothetical protein EJV47_20800 [Hymenobacter gummosus]|uniref:Uncharacterized protein n=1 Tax=Hymenobacter gummosus TaxID=1776032 RepID=A0A3S0H2H1_9BACT|nr:hypothetical protein [Hymenobacter gummosus]RTQ46814.1 hypothetical protein EJV47_20800 [Hymenobacter gummosus]
MPHSPLRSALLPGLVAALLALPARAQQPDSVFHPPALQPVFVPKYFPVYLLNARLIVGDRGLRAIGPQAIQNFELYRSVLATPVRWRSLVPHGLMVLTLKKEVRLRLSSRSQAQIRRRLKLPAAARFELDGLPLEDAKLRIATADIEALDIKTAPGAAPVINVRLVRLPPRPHPPGTILIQGLTRQQ